ncbi:MAG: efflux RND transporter periplasmic adaptor subunit [Bryobacteraceae bacterium]
MLIAQTRSTSPLTSICAASAALFLLVAGGCKKQEAPSLSAAQAPSITVQVIQVQPETFPLTVPVTGTLISKTAVDVKAEITGRLVAFPKEEGDAVSAGEVIASVDEENYRLALRQAQASVEVAEAALNRAQIMASHAKSELERARNLVRSGGITQKDLEAAQLADRDAQAQVVLAEAQLAQARAAVDTAQKRLRDTAIRVPVAGSIQRKYVNVGAYVEPPTLVASVVDNRQLELESPVPAAYLGQVRPGQKVTFRVNSFPDTLFEGQLLELNPAVDSLTRSAKARIRVNNSGGRLRAGMFAQGEILTGVRQDAIVVPAAAVYRGTGSGQESYVFVVENGKAARRTVQLGREADSRLEISAGLKPGDVVIAEQRLELAEGVPVQTAR